MVLRRVTLSSPERALDRAPWGIFKGSSLLKEQDNEHRSKEGDS